MTKHPDPTLERIAERIPMPEPAYERLLRRRDRKRRNQRLVASSVAIAVFASALWLLTGGPHGSAHRPIATPTNRPIGDPFSVSAAFYGLPTQGTRPSTPLHGELVWSDHEIHGWKVHVYSDGRVIWFNGADTRFVWLERRLTPEGVDLLRTEGPIGLGFEDLRASLWKDPQAEQYVPSKYAACAARASIDRLSPPARYLLRGSTSARAVRRGERLRGSHVSCPMLTLGEARHLGAILEASGFVSTGLTYVRAGSPAKTGEISIELLEVLPEGKLDLCCPG